MEKTYVFDGGGSSGTNTDSLLLGSMMNGGGMNGMWNNPIWAIVFLAALRNGGIFGGDCNNGNGQLSQIQETLNTNQGNMMLMDAIKGNSAAIGQLATTIGCNQAAVIGAINQVQSAICQVGNQVGMGTAQIINAVNMGDTGIISTLQSCCCDLKNLVTTQGYQNQISNLQQSQLIQNGFATIGYNQAEQTCAIKQNTTDNTSRILAKLDAMEDSRKDREINNLTAALTAANARAERQSELAPIYKALSDIECKQPQTVNVPYSPIVGVPNCVAWGYGLNGYPFNNGGFL